MEKYKTHDQMNFKEFLKNFDENYFCATNEWAAIVAANLLFTEKPNLDSKTKEKIEKKIFDVQVAGGCGLDLSLSQTDRLLPETDQGGGFELVVYSDDYKTEGPVCRWPAKYRKVDAIPCLEPWVDQ